MSTSKEPIAFAGCFRNDSSPESSLVFVGIPDDSQSSYRVGCADGPKTIRSAYDGRSFNSTTESGVNLEAAITDLGDVVPEETWEASAENYRGRIRDLLRKDQTPFVAGGDHAVTVPVVEAFAGMGAPVHAIHVVQIDAHPDVYEDFEGSRSSHACVAARLLEMEHVASVTQLGIRTLNAGQSGQLERYSDRLRILYAKDLLGKLPKLSHIAAGAPVYLTVDLDGLDPSVAPGVSHPVPGGLTSRQVLSFIASADWRLVGMDVVELNPSVDFNQLTAILAARLLHEGMGYAARTTGVCS
jgi:agmatinase